MGHRINETYHKTEEAAQQAQREVEVKANYSETYALGVFPCRMINRATGAEYDGFRSVTETYYG